MRTTELDDKDLAIMNDRIATWNAISGPRVGDWCQMLDGTMRRFTHDWGDSLQTTHSRFGHGSFYLGDGYMEYSGALDPSIPKVNLVDTGTFQSGKVWFFHHNIVQAYNGVVGAVDFRVFKEIHGDDEKSQPMCERPDREAVDAVN